MRSFLPDIHKPLPSTPAASPAKTAAMDSSILNAVGFVHLHVHSAYLAARGRARRSRRSPSSPRPTPCRRSRSPTPTTCSAPSNSPRSWRRAASSRSSARRSRSTSATRRPSSSRLAELRVARAPIVLLAQSETRLPQPDAARLLPLARPEGGRRGAHPVRRARRRRGPDRADRRPRRARSTGRSRAHMADLAEARLDRLARSLRRPALCRAAAPRPRVRGSRPSRR